MKNKIVSILFVVVFVIASLLLPENPKCKAVALLEDVLHHLIGVLIFFVLFEKTIRNLLVGNKFSEKPKFDAEEYFSMIRKSNKEVKILETYIELLLDKKGQFRETLQAFVDNAIKHNNVPAINILLINPFSKFATTRLEQLYGYYQKLPEYKNVSKEKYIEIRRGKMEEALREISELKNDVENYARNKTKLDFSVKIYDAPFFYSIYACDTKGYFGLYHGDRPSVSSPQLVAHDMYSDPSNFLLSRFEDIWDNNKSIPLTTYLNIPQDKKSFNIIEKFNQIWETNDVEEIFSLLKELSPDKIDDTELFALVSYLESKQKILVPKHYNVFGSGGDKTINISTMSAIMASHYKDNIVVKKVGTRAVTSQVGSFSFHAKIIPWLHDNKDNPLLQGLNTELLKFNTHNKSEFHSVGFFGFEYRDNVIDARNKIFENKLLDIFKVIFPVANFTNCYAQVNGYANNRYGIFYERIFSHFGKTGIIVHSDYKGGTDEVCLGNNELLVYSAGKKIDVVRPQIRYKTEDDKNECLAFLNEGREDEHVVRFIKLLRGEVCDTIKEIFSWNIATIVKLKYIDDNTQTIGKIKNEVFDYYFGQKP